MTLPPPDDCVDHIQVKSSDIVRDGIRLNVGRLPIAVTDDDRDGVFVASDSFSTAYGAGDTRGAAFDEYLDSLFAHYDFLAANHDRLSPRLAAELAALSHYFVCES